jgi:hypothetical protein
VLGAVALLLIAVVFTPWAFRIGGSLTPASWYGLGTLRTQAGDEYPLLIFFYPDLRSMSRLRLNGQRPTSGLRGDGWLCSAQGVTQRLDLTGDIYGTYLNTDGNQMSIRLLDARRYFQINAQNQRRYFDLTGSWHGSELAMQDDGGWEREFHHDPHNPKERAQVTFTPGTYSDFIRACNAASIPEKARIAPPSN